MLKLFLIVLLAFNVFASAWGAVAPDSECQSHRKQPAKTGTRVHVRCDEMGLYEPLQCTEDDPDICACYNQTGPVTDFQLDLTACECPTQRYLAQQNGTETCLGLPDCRRDGRYVARKCCSFLIHSTIVCWCQHPFTGILYDVGSLNLTCESPDVTRIPIDEVDDEWKNVSLEKTMRQSERALMELQNKPLKAG